MRVRACADIAPLLWPIHNIHAHAQDSAQHEAITTHSSIDPMPVFTTVFITVFTTHCHLPRLVSTPLVNDT
jgi:hypothetical protein